MPQCEHGDVVLERTRVEGLVHVDGSDGDDDAPSDDVVVRSTWEDAEEFLENYTKTCLNFIVPLTK